MLNKEILSPQSIVVVGASNDVKKPGGKMLKNILDGGFKGDLFVINLKEEKVQGIATHASVKSLPETDLAILAIPAPYCLEVVTILAQQKRTRAFIIISAGFGEADPAGAALEKQITDVVNSVNGCLIGPNCIGVITQNYKGVFTSPIPTFDPGGCDLISGSGATAVFIIEAGMALGVTFANVFSVGNGAQTSTEDILEYMDLHFDPSRDAPVKLLYLETIKDPAKLQKHATSLRKKGVKIAAIKAGSTAEGSRAATSHTGALASSDMTVRALFQKAGIVYCSSREELLSVASIFKYKPLQGKNIAIITHAGGSAVMLADALANGGLNIPPIQGPDAEKLKTYLHPGSSVANPIDFLATGTAEQLGIIIDYCEHKFDHIDAMVVVFGSPGLFDVEHVYNVLRVKLDLCKKPIFPVLPSVINAQKEIQSFIAQGHINFPDEVVLGKALTQVYKTPQPASEEVRLPAMDSESIRAIIDRNKDGYLNIKDTEALMYAAKIPQITTLVENQKDVLLSEVKKLDFPVVMKVVGPLHKTDAKGVLLNITSLEEASEAFDQLMRIEAATAVMVQPQLTGLELFVGVSKEPYFPHTILCGLGGIFIEILNDFAAGLAPISEREAKAMLRSLRGYKLLLGVRSTEGIDETVFIDIIKRIAGLVQIAPEITEMDINPLIGTNTTLLAVDVRVKIDRSIP
ncbi:acetate--CoA ligase family protein [Altibacter sp.]|uniref:acetate--CoA ligase family protein n=1 Tax=Altibacter sp. TaxID=2024823 RepID=UPI00258DE18F|nr:acetate--CoA ligase family protein [Altibacter sp.]MCW9037286.1 acetate--CoA ligase family protein [Altibacter sp.]